jgi:hypothetical protein
MPVAGLSAKSLEIRSSFFRLLPQTIGVSCESVHLQRFLIILATAVTPPPHDASSGPETGADEPHTSMTSVIAEGISSIINALVR